MIISRLQYRFNEDIGITGAILTKMDGDTRGGSALSVRAVSGKPIKFMGVGEGTYVRSVTINNYIISSVNMIHADQQLSSSYFFSTVSNLTIQTYLQDFSVLFISTSIVYLIVFNRYIILKVWRI